MNTATRWAPPGSSHSGLGLHIVRQVVHARNGTVWVSAVSEGGTSVTLRMPLTRVAHPTGVLANLHVLPTQGRTPARTTT